MSLPLGRDDVNSLDRRIRVNAGGEQITAPRMELQTASSLASTALLGGSDVTWTVDLRTVEYNGFMQLTLESAETKVLAGIDGLTVTVIPVVYNDVGTVIVPTNATALTLTTAGNISSVGDMVAFDISRAFQDSGDLEDHLSLQGLRFVFSEATVDEGSNIIGELLVR